ncbi:hypothetical protein AB1K62_06895 [Parasphingorhabdus sp. JC815]|uniref:hypothetical protein n=1 Tax=Parasphingorhabdus sp. JC815 TaxID=3232140 RepID=UPI0034586844
MITPLLWVINAMKALAKGQYLTDLAEQVEQWTKAGYQSRNAKQNASKANDGSAHYQAVPKVRINHSLRDH